MRRALLVVREHNVPDEEETERQRQAHAQKIQNAPPGMWGVVPRPGPATKPHGFEVMRFSMEGGEAAGAEFKVLEALGDKGESWKLLDNWLASGWHFVSVTPWDGTRLLVMLEEGS